jgi:hypothetical protein
MKSLHTIKSNTSAPPINIQKTVCFLLRTRNGIQSNGGLSLKLINGVVWWRYDHDDRWQVLEERHVIDHAGRYDRFEEEYGGLGYAMPEFSLSLLTEVVYE